MKNTSKGEKTKGHKTGRLMKTKIVKGKKTVVQKPRMVLQIEERRGRGDKEHKDIPACENENGLLSQFSLESYNFLSKNFI